MAIDDQAALGQNISPSEGYEDEFTMQLRTFGYIPALRTLTIRGSKCPVAIREPREDNDLPQDDLTMQLDAFGYLPPIRTLSIRGSKCRVCKRPGDPDYNKP